MSFIVGFFTALFASLFGGNHHATPPVKSPMEDAQIRLRTTKTALEAFYIDNNSYPESTTGSETIAFRGAPKGTPGFKWFPPVPAPNFSASRDSRPEIYLAEMPAPRNGSSYPAYSLTTPIAYMREFQKDPFSADKETGFAYLTNGKNYLLWSPGPDGKYDMPWEEYDLNAPSTSADALAPFTYDPTNGAVSGGDLWFASRNERK